MAADGRAEWVAHTAMTTCGPAGPGEGLIGGHGGAAGPCLGPAAGSGSPKMNKNYAVSALSEDKVDRAFPLIRALEPDLDLDDWRRFCREGLGKTGHDGSAGTVFVASNPRGYLQGLCVAALPEGEREARVLEVPIFIAASVADGEGVAAEMMEFLEAYGRDKVCGGIRIWPLDRDNWKRLVEHAPPPAEAAGTTIPLAGG